MSNFTFKEAPILVTGGSGFIGTHLIGALIDVGANPLNIDLRPPKIELHRSFWREADLLDTTTVAEVVSEHRPVLVFNLAAETDITKSGEAFDVNTRGLSSLLEACSLLEAPPHLVHFSTQLVVGPGHRPVADDDLNPYSAYGQSKAESERILRRFEGTMSWTIVRPTTVWGPYHPTFITGVWKYLAARLYMTPTGRPPMRSYGYVGNVVEQVMRIALSAPERVDGATFFVGDAPIPATDWLDAFSQALSNRPVRRAPYSLLWLMALAGETSRFVGGPSPINFGRLERMSTDYAVPMEPTFAVLGVGSTTLSQGVIETVKWIKGNE